MRLAYLNASLGIPVQGPSGASSHLRQFSLAAQNTFDFRLFSSLKKDHRGAFGPDIKAEIVGQVPFPRYREVREILSSRRLFRYILANSWSPEIILERHSLFSDAGWRLGERLNIPWMLEVNAPLFEERVKYEHLRLVGLGRKWQKEVLRACPMIFAVSRWLQEWLENEIGCRKVHLLPNGTPYYIGNPSRGRALLDIDSDRPIVGFVGSARPWQGSNRVPAIAKKVGAISVCVGTGYDCGADIQRSFYNQQELADVISSFSVAVAPYTSDAPPWLSPLKIIQYRGQGIPIVSSDVGDAKHIVGDAGSVVPVNDHNGFVDAVQFSLGRKPNPFVRSWETVVDELYSHVHEWLKTG